MKKYLYTISDGLTSRQKLDVSQAIGRILPGDYGKQVFDVDGIIQVENDGQRDTRLADEKQITLEQFIEKHGLQFECRRVDSRKDGLMSDSSGQRHFRCRVTSNRGIYDNKQGQQVASGQSHSFSLYFSQGSAHTDDPTLADVLDCLASDASGYDNAKSFEDWASEYGYDTDSRSAEKIYKTVKRQAEQLKRVLGAEAFEELLYKTERL